MVAVGPEGTSVTFDVPLPLSDNAERWLKAILFYGLLGIVVLLCLVGAVATYRIALPPPGRTAKVAFVALLIGFAGWIAIEYRREAHAPRAPWCTCRSTGASDGQLPGARHRPRAPCPPGAQGHGALPRRQRRFPRRRHSRKP